MALRLIRWRSNVDRLIVRQSPGQMGDGELDNVGPGLAELVGQALQFFEDGIVEAKRGLGLGLHERDDPPLVVICKSHAHARQ